MIHVCSLARLHDTVAASGARHVVTLINAQTPVQRPASILESNHLFIGINDIVEEVPGFVAPAEEHVARLLDFVRVWHASREAPLVVHCWAGISRSTAAAFTTVCALAPERDELDIARRLRAASPTAIAQSAHRPPRRRPARPARPHGGGDRGDRAGRRERGGRALPPFARLSGGRSSRITGTGRRTRR